MKNLFLATSLLLAVLSCQTEKDVPKTISPEQSSHIREKSGVDITGSGMLSNDPEYYKNTTHYKGEQSQAARFEARSNFNQDVEKYKIPRTCGEVVAKYPDWKDFEMFCKEKHSLVSARTNQFLAKQLLWAYNFQEKAYSKSLAQTLKPYLIYLADKEYRDFHLFYVYIKWYNDNGDNITAMEIRGSVLNYAQNLSAPSVMSNSSAGNEMAQSAANKLHSYKLEQRGYITRIKELL